MYEPNRVPHEPVVAMFVFVLSIEPWAFSCVQAQK